MSSERPPDRTEEVQPLKKLVEVALERYGLQDARHDFLKKGGNRRWVFRVSLSSQRLSQLLRRCAVAAVNEEPSCILSAHGCQRSTHRLDEGVLGAGADLP